MEIIEVEGEDDRLYGLVGHLVMSPEILRYNLNYPFRTSREYRWFVAVEGGNTLGFAPVKVADDKAEINNYYVADDDSAVFTALLNRAVSVLAHSYRLDAVSQTRHQHFFERCGFSVVHYWKRYVKMSVARDEKECV